ncbi:uncharacterized protein LOC116144925 [Pistacia vera]|uniref:uncharacterized protein LOC116144925 n=1 Tax=Pistacia vera TaxID=55513 RepID=UPI0012638808|nr:uncharacterized protein LOC116144925 [Pistacia vera]
MINVLTNRITEILLSMDKKETSAISLRAWVDKEKNKIVFVESDEDFIDVLFSFLTMPMGTIIRLIRKQPPSVGLGCLKNLYGSVENLGVQQFQTAVCKNMLLYPRNGSAAQCEKLKLKIDDGQTLKYFLCCNKLCTLSGYKLLSPYSDAICDCQEHINREVHLLETEVAELLPSCTLYDYDYNGVFVREQTRFIISDELQVLPSCTESRLSLLSKLVGSDWSTIEERNFDIGVDEVLTLLKFALSETPLTETLLKNSLANELGKEDFHQGGYVKSRMEEPASNVNKKIHVKLITSKSWKMVCYAEAGEDFVDLLFSFLTVPLGHVVKEMHSSISKGCINHLYNSVHELDAEKYLKSNEHKAMLVNPKLAPGFSYENNPLGIEEDIHPPYYYAQKKNEFGDWHDILSYDKARLSSWIQCYSQGSTISTLTVKETTRRGFAKGPAMFTITDKLIITPISSISCLSLLSKLDKPVADIEERVVHVGCEEALRLMVASFVSESVLTDAFLRDPNPEH